MGETLHPDWYPDPENSGLLRWWDGTAWTRQTRPASPLDPEPGDGAAPGPENAAGPAGVGPAPPGPALPPLGRLAQPVDETAGTRRRPRRAWLIGGGAGVVLLAAAAAALALTGVFSKPGPAAPRGAATAAAAPAHGRVAASPVPSPVALGADIVDRRAGISYRIPEDPGWRAIPRAALDRWTLGYRKLAQRAGTGTGSGGGPGTAWAELKSGPLPASYRYTGPDDLRPDGVRLAGELASRHYPAPHRTVQLGVTRHGANGHGRAWYVIEFRIYYRARPAGPAGVTSQTAALVIAGRGISQRPAVLFITIPDTMDTTLVHRIAATVAARR